MITIGELAGFIQLPPDTIDTGAAEACIQGAATLVREELGQSIDFVADDVLTMESPGGRLLLLPEVPVVDVTVVRERRPGGDWTVLVDGTDYEAVLGREARLWRIGGARWPRSTGGLNGFVEVTNSHGYNTTTTDIEDAPPLPEIFGTVVKRVAARGYANPESITQETIGTDTTAFGSTVTGLYLTAEDRRDLSKFRPGSRGGSR